jgi:hypothetical protein
MKEGIEAVPQIVKRLYELVGELEAHFPGRRFTPDGHLVGSIGEVLAAYHYGLDLHAASVATHDACCPRGNQVQVKATQGRSVALREEPDYLLVLKLNRAGTVDEIYNGPGRIPWEQAGRMQRNGQRPISLSRLKKLMNEVRPEERLYRLVD